MSTRIDRDDAARAAEELCLERKVGIIAATPMDEERERRILGQNRYHRE